MEACAACGKLLPENIRETRHRPKDDNRPLTCNRECEVQRRKKLGMFKAMSVKGREARSRAVTVSNQINPRRKKAN